MRIPGSYADIVPRVLSGVVLAALGLASVLLGGWWFRAAVFLVIAAIVWELGRMLASAQDERGPDEHGPGDGRPAPGPNVLRVAAAATAALVVGVATIDPGAGLVLLAVPSALVLTLPLPHRRAVAAYLLLVCVGGAGFLGLREGFEALWLLWLVLVVVGSDVAGYFAGRTFGGPKLWPRVSPKKTWSGTVAGWAVALALALAFLWPLGQGAGFVVLTLAICIAGQAGDIAESALKRRVGVKDSSQLIPGHGGVMDRFDAMLGAAVAFHLAALAGLVAQG